MAAPFSFWLNSRVHVQTVNIRALHVIQPAQKASAQAELFASALTADTNSGPLAQVFTITTPPQQQELEAADQLVRRLAPGARRTYALGGTQKYELPTAEVSLSQVCAGRLGNYVCFGFRVHAPACGCVRADGCHGTWWRCPLGRCPRGTVDT